MSKKLTNKKTYAGFKIITSNEDNDYLLCEDSLSEILHSLRHARDKLKRPLAVRYTIGLNNDHSFDISKLTRKVRESFRHTGYSLIYSFEYSEGQKGLHLELVFVFDQDVYTPNRVFNIFRGYLFNMDGVLIENDDTSINGYKCVSLNFHERKEDYIQSTGGSKAGHNLKDKAQFEDAFNRASYLAKQNDKQQVQYKRKFNTIER